MCILPFFTRFRSLYHNFATPSIYQHTHLHTYRLTYSHTPTSTSYNHVHPPIHSPASISTPTPTFNTHLHPHTHPHQSAYLYTHLLHPHTTRLPTHRARQTVTRIIEANSGASRSSFALVRSSSVSVGQ